MSDDHCAFCDVVSGRLPAEIVYQDEQVLAFLAHTRQPEIAAHTLIIPKKHVENVYGIGDDLGRAIFSAQVKVAQAIKHALQPDGLTIWSSNGEGAGQEVPHYHLHIFPRMIGDGNGQMYAGMNIDFANEQLAPPGLLQESKERILAVSRHSR